MEVLFDNVLVKAEPVDQIGDVILPAQYEDKPEFGVVIKVGPGLMHATGMVVPTTVQVGDMVYFNKYSTTKFKVDKEDYYVVREEDIISYER